ncbi:ATP-binding protein [Streptomyces sp. NBC_00299]|uniref:ATP-binding protein n=1 Tax=Streptomyces sp. NBC_00299 TaxID=2975705 RepID=UPI003FA7B9B3
MSERGCAGCQQRTQVKYGVAVSQRALDLTLVVSELVTNARKYAPGPVPMHLRLDGDVVDVEVWDSDPVLSVAWAGSAQEWSSAQSRA